MSRFPLAKIALERGDLDRADALYREALRSPRDPVAARLGLATVALRREDRAGAEREARAAMEERPHDPRPFVFLARMHPGTGRAAQLLFEAQRRGYRASDAERRSLLDGRFE
jgi:Tfp pilus assembly protein PilF